MSSSQQGVLEEWRYACEAIHREMDELLMAGFLLSEPERQKRQQRFLELIRQREEAARRILPVNEASKRVKGNAEAVPILTKG